MEAIWDNVLKFKHTSSSVKNARRWIPTFPSGLTNLVVCWNPIDVLNIWNKNINIKPCSNWTFFKLLNFFWTIDIESGLSFFILKFEVQGISKRMIESQIYNLIPNHQNVNEMMSNWSMHWKNSLQKL